MITLDTSAVLALLDPKDRYHETASQMLSDGPQMVVAAPVLSEMTSVIEQRLGPRFVPPFLRGFEQGNPFPDCADTDLPRTLELIERYADLELGFADAAVIACAERNGGRVLTFDRHDLEVVARDVPIDLVP